MYEGLGDTNIALPKSYFGRFPQTIAPRTPLPTRTTAGIYFNAPLYTPTIPKAPVAPAPSPWPTTVKPSITPAKLPVLVAKPTLTPDTFGTPSLPAAAPGSPSVNVSVSGGAGVTPSGTVATETPAMAGMFGLSDLNPTTLIFLAMAALVVFMESGKKGRR